MLPALTSDGFLPPGIHRATFDEVADRFTWSMHRRRLLLGLERACGLLRAAGCRRIWIGGSFVTAKERPGDFDVVWDPDGVDLDDLDPVLMDLDDGRRRQKQRFGGELLPNVVEASSGSLFLDYFQKKDGRPVGIVELVLENVRTRGS